MFKQKCKDVSNRELNEYRNGFLINGEINYLLIDKEIREYIKILNSKKGIKTIFSCAGHMHIDNIQGNIIEVPYLIIKFENWKLLMKFVDNLLKTRTHLIYGIFRKLELRLATEKQTDKYFLDEERINDTLLEMRRYFYDSIVTAFNKM
jgi:hypothetical protein